MVEQRYTHTHVWKSNAKLITMIQSHQLSTHEADVPEQQSTCPTTPQAMGPKPNTKTTKQNKRQFCSVEAVNSHMLILKSLKTVFMERGSWYPEEGSYRSLDSRQGSMVKIQDIIRKCSPSVICKLSHSNIFSLEFLWRNIE